METETTTDAMNEVRLRGRVADAAVARELPSGDRLVTFRLIVDRARPAGRRRVDTLDCACWTKRTQRSALSWAAADVVEVTGALRRRFFAGAAGTASRVEIEVETARRVSRADSAAAAS